MICTSNVYFRTKAWSLPIGRKIFFSMIYDGQKLYRKVQNRCENFYFDSLPKLDKQLHNGDVSECSG